MAELMRKVPTYHDWRLRCNCRRQDTTVPWRMHELTCDIGYGPIDATDADVMETERVTEPESREA